MATSGTDRIRFLLELGEADQRGAWPDYLNYGLTEADVPALLDLVTDETFDQADSESSEVCPPSMPDAAHRPTAGYQGLRSHR